MPDAISLDWGGDQGAADRFLVWAPAPAHCWGQAGLAGDPRQLLAACVAMLGLEQLSTSILVCALHGCDGLRATHCQHIDAVIHGRGEPTPLVGRTFSVL